MAYREIKVNVYTYGCQQCGKDVKTSSPIKCADCGIYLCATCGDLNLCIKCQSTLSKSALNSLKNSKRNIRLITWSMVIIGIIMIIGDSIGALPNISSAIIGFMLMVFSIPYYFLSTLVFFPKKARNAKYRKGNSINSSEIITTKEGREVDMSNNALTTFYKCTKCGNENRTIPVYTDENGKYYTICTCGEKASEDNSVYQCSMCKKYYPPGYYRCPKCKMDEYSRKRAYG